MNVKTLKESPEKLNECVELIEQAFGYNDNYSYKEDFSPLFHEHNLQNCYFIEEEGLVTATLLTLPKMLEYKDIKLPALFIGGIGVRDENRGAGLFRSLLETVLLLNSHYALYLLWSDLSQLYEKFNFYEFGLIEENDLGEEKPQDLKEFPPEDLETVITSYQSLSSHTLVPHRTPEDWHDLFQSQSIDHMTDGKGHFYFLNKGMDLQGVCHERHPLNSPDLAGYSNWCYTPENAERVSRYMGFLRLGNLEALSDFIEKTSNKRLFIVERNTEGLITVSFDGDYYDLSEKDFIQGIWGPGQIEEWIGLIPPLVIFGHDSI